MLMEIYTGEYLEVELSQAPDNHGEDWLKMSSHKLNEQYMVSSDCRGFRLWDQQNFRAFNVVVVLLFPPPPPPPPPR